jgi:hypothetical protein
MIAGGVGLTVRSENIYGFDSRTSLQDWQMSGASLS